jgi:hypothetical protein
MTFNMNENHAFENVAQQVFFLITEYLTVPSSSTEVTFLFKENEVGPLELQNTY